MVVDLGTQLVALLDPEARAGTAPVLEVQLVASLAAARRRWPDAPLPDDEFAHYVLERARRQADLAAALPRLRVDDLLLAWWASGGDARAIAAFEATHHEALQRLLARFHRLDPDELRQLLRIKLFIGTETAPPRVLEYSGFGFLENWFKVLAARTFLDAARSTQRERTDELSEAAMLELTDPEDNPRDAAARTQLTRAVKRALEQAIAELSARERTFLRHVTIDGMTLEQIASTYEVSRVTVARALAAARKQLHDVTRALVVAALGVTPSGLASAIEMLDSQIDLSLARMFPESTLTT